MVSEMNKWERVVKEGGDQGGVDALTPHGVTFHAT